MSSLPWNVLSFATSHPSDTARASSAGNSPAQEDVFAEEREWLQLHTHALIDQAAVLRRKLDALNDRQEILVASGAPPAFDINDDTLAWLGALPQAILPAPPTGDTVLEQAVARASTNFGAACITLGASMCDVAMHLSTADFSARQLRALGLRPQGVLMLTAHFDPTYHLAPEPPALTIEYSAPGGPPQVATSAISGAKQHFRLGYQLLNILAQHLRRVWKAGASEEVLSDLFALASGRLRDLPQHCIVCDQAMAVAQLRPTTCHEAGCIGQAETHGYGFEPQDILQNAEVADLLISMTAAAAAAQRDAFFKRLPVTFRPQGKTDFEALIREIDRLPAVQTLADSQDMIGTLDTASPTALSTLSWLMVGNEGFLEYLPPHEQFPAMGTPHQFRIFGGPLEREAAFAALPDPQHNRYAFHGSPFGNWHSILRTGLVVGSPKSGLGFTGAYHGTGIYVSNNSATSLGYCYATNVGWRHSRFGKNPVCLALCETHGASRGSKPGTPLRGIEVFPNANAVALRYLFVYDFSDANVTFPHVQAGQAATYLQKFAEKAESRAPITPRRPRWRHW